MSIAFIVLVVLHGLLHLLGFVKAFGIADVKQLAQPISKPFGVMWLLAFVMCAVTAALFALRYDYWWLVGFIAVALSQVLIILFWQDAKFGTVANVIILIASIIGYTTWSYYERYHNDVTAAMQHSAPHEPDVLTEADIAHLPESVQKYLRYTGSVGQPKVYNFSVEFTGKIRKDEQSAWMPFTSEQYNFMQTPTRLFFMKATMFGLPVAGYHSFRNGEAYMDIRALSLVRVQYQEGAAMDISETVTFFNDMCCMAPATLIDNRITWLDADSNRVHASFTNNGITITAWLYFNETGELINFVSNDRHSAESGKQQPWSTPLKDYQYISGYKLASDAQTIYAFPDRELMYGTFKLSSVKYNVGGWTGQ